MKMWKRICSVVLAASLLVTVEASYLVKYTVNAAALEPPAGDKTEVLIWNRYSGGDSYEELEALYREFAAADDGHGITEAEPEKVISEQGGNDNASGKDFVIGIIQFAGNTALGEVFDRSASYFDKFAATSTQTAEELIRRGNSRINAAQRVIDHARVGSRKYNNAQKSLNRGQNKLNEAAKLKDTASKAGFAGKAFDVLGVGLGAWGIYNDISDLQNLKNEHSSMRVLEGGLLCADIGITGLGIAATIIGFTNPVGLGVGIAVGVASFAMHSDLVTNWLNNADNGFLDFLDSFTETLFPWMKTPKNVNCYKPNVYIYSADNRKVLVRFLMPKLLTVTIPDYRDVWEVETGSNGQLFDEDGNEYGYLFYESVTEASLFRTDSGWLINADTREEQYRKILETYGFTTTEINDFVEFWCTKLEPGVDYVMYPQYTETVDYAMPVEIIPEPETIVRMWFVFDEYEGGDIEEESILPFERTEYTVVEWGGIILD